MLYADDSYPGDGQPSALTVFDPINGRNAHLLRSRSTQQGGRPVGAILLPPDPENTFHAVPSCQSLQLPLNPNHSSGASAAFARFHQQQLQMEPPLPILRCPGLDRSVGNTPKCSAHSAGNTIGPPSPAGLVVVPASLWAAGIQRESASDSPASGTSLPLGALLCRNAVF